MENTDKLNKKDFEEIRKAAIAICDGWLSTLVSGVFDGLSQEELEQLRKEAGIS